MFQKKVTQKNKTHILCLITNFFNRAVYEIMWKNIVDPNRAQITVFVLYKAFSVLYAITI
jgi:hypothetical protein